MAFVNILLNLTQSQTKKKTNFSYRLNADYDQRKVFSEESEASPNVSPLSPSHPTHQAPNT